MPSFFSIKKPSLSTTLIFIYALSFIYLYFFQGYAAWHYTVDDAYITLRYALHLAHGDGLVWNIGEPRIEGYSNFMYLLFGAMAIYFKLNAILFLKIISAISVALSVFGLYLLSRFWLPKHYCLLSGLILLIHPGEVIWGVSGLETPFFQCLIIFATYFLLRTIPAKKEIQRPDSGEQKSVAISGLLIALASLTRPEGPMLFLCFGFLLCFVERTLKSLRLGILILSFSLAYAPYFFWRLVYFGHLFPNSVYCKALNAPTGRFELDLAYLFIMLPLFIFIVPYLRYAYERRHLFLIFPSLCYLIVLYNADWIVGFLERHFLAAYALLLPLFICGIRYLFTLKPLRIKGVGRVYLIVFMSFLAGYLFTGNRYTPSQYFFTSNSAKEGTELRQDVASWLTQHVKENEQVSLGDCGLIPYLYQGPIIDSYCLNNLAMTKKPIYYSYPRFTEWLLYTKKPAYIILLSLLTTKKAYYPPSDLILLSNADFNQQYKKIKRFEMGTERGGYQYSIYKRIKLDDKKIEIEV
jgi:hypothetical protein